MLIKPFHPIESPATASHSWRRGRCCARAYRRSRSRSSPQCLAHSSMLGTCVCSPRATTRVTIELDQPLQTSRPAIAAGATGSVVDLNGLDLDSWS